VRRLVQAASGIDHARGADLRLSFLQRHRDAVGHAGRQLLLQDVQLRASQFDDPLLTCRLLYVRHDFWSLLSGQTTPAEIQIEGAALILPAMLAPGGTAGQLDRGGLAAFLGGCRVLEEGDRVLVRRS